MGSVGLGWGEERRLDVLSARTRAEAGEAVLVPGPRASVQGGQRGAAGHLGLQLCSGPRAPEGRGQAEGEPRGDGAQDQGRVFRAGRGLCHVRRGAETPEGGGVLRQTLF